MTPHDWGVVPLKVAVLALLASIVIGGFRGYHEEPRDRVVGVLVGCVGGVIVLLASVAIGGLAVGMLWVLLL